MTASNPTFSSVQEKRRQFQTEANEIGVTEEFIGRVVDSFYEKVVLDPDIGLIFTGKINSRWNEHLTKMKQFWSSVALTTGTYSGKPYQVHVEIPEIKTSQFSVWLGLFEETLNELCPTPEAKEHMLSRAKRIARSLQMAIEMREGALAL